MSSTSPHGIQLPAFRVVPGRFDVAVGGRAAAGLGTFPTDGAPPRWGREVCR